MKSGDATRNPLEVGSGITYNKRELITSLRLGGIASGDTVFVHVSLGRLGYPEEGRTISSACEVLDQALTEVVGDGGTILVPTYTYSIGKGQAFDVAETPSAVGSFTEFFRLKPDTLRSAEPMLAVSGWGRRAGELLGDLPHTCYGPGSLYDRMHDDGVKLCTIGLGLHWATYRHYIEERARVPFRFLKLFSGVVREEGRDRFETWTCSVAPHCSNCQPDGVALEKLLIEAGLCRTTRLGRGEICVIDCREYRKFGLEQLRRDPWISAKGPACSVSQIVASEDERVGGEVPSVHLPESASLFEILTTLGPLRRDIVSDGYDVSLQALASQVSMTIHEYPTGCECFTWIIPEKWTCKRAYLESMDGRRIFSYEDHPLHVVSYSLPFDGDVDREELLRHLHVHPCLPDATPFVFKYYERDWGLCCSRNMRDTLSDDKYRVLIDSSFSYGTLKVGEVTLPGKTETTIVLCAHLCHPGQVNDDLTGVAVGLGVMRALSKLSRYYTYKLLIVPETIGSIAWLSHNESLIPKMKGGVFLEMMGRSYPPTFQHSLAGDTEVDLCFELGIRSVSPNVTVIPFMPMNDERQFNSPGISVPMGALYRTLPKEHPDWPYFEYHSSQDDINHVDPGCLEESCVQILAMLDALESNAVPVPLYRAEIFLSRYGLHVDWHQDPEASQQLYAILYQIDGVRSIAEIAAHLKVSFRAVRAVTDRLLKHGLCRLVRSDAGGAR